MWTNAQRDGRPAEYRWHPLFKRRKVWLTPTAGVPCSSAAKTRNPLKFAGVPQIGKPISAVSGPKFTILSEHVEEVLLLNKFFSDGRYVPYSQRYSSTIMCDDAQMAIFCVMYFQRAACSTLQTCILNSHHVCKYGRHPIGNG